MIKAILIILFILALIPLYCACKVSGKCSKIEEEREYINKK